MMGRKQMPQQPPQLVPTQALQAMDIQSMQRQSMHQETDADYDEHIQREGLVKFVKFLVEDSSIPDNLTKDFWAFTDKEVVLTALTKDTDRILRRKMAIAIDQYLMGIPQYKITPQKLLILENLKTKWDLKRYRAMGGFERTLQATQIRENVLDVKGRGQSPGLLRRLSMGALGK